ncbi:MAG: RNA 2',3'-cyclic phosphodiesterase [Proteobacteria bacterium]|nr:RNA 2',3'-cyclic phosphodiesterase [Pseudomonadota bacterium]
MGAEIPDAAAPREPARRLFFALWPDEPMRQAMAEATAEAARASGGRPVPAGNLHVTMAFLGSVPERRLADLAEAARGAALGPERDPLELSFDHLEYWPGAQLLCAAPGAPSAPAAALAGGLKARLAQSGFAPDLKPFRPHVTVVRKVSSAGRIGKMPPVMWRFTHLALIESRPLPEGSLYSVVDSYVLCSG